MSQTTRQSKRGPNRQNKGIQPAIRKQKPRQQRRGKPAVANSPLAVNFQLAAGLRRGFIFQNDMNSTRVRKAEFLQNITGTTLWTLLTTIATNPGLAASFPWLSNMAQGWERYTFKRLCYHYITRTGMTTPGSFLLAPDFDASDSPPSSEQIMSDYTDADECPPFADPEDGHYRFEIDCKKLHRVQKELYVRTGALAANQDVKLYDGANIYCSTVDGTAVSWGKLWVEYEVEFYQPQIPSGGFAGSGVLLGAGGSLAAATPFGALPTSSGSYALNAAATNVISMTGLSIGQEYAAYVNIGGTVISALSMAVTTGGTLKTGLFGGFPAAATSGSVSLTFIATASTATLTLSVTATTVTFSNMLLAAITPAPASY